MKAEAEKMTKAMDEALESALSNSMGIDVIKHTTSEELDYVQKTLAAYNAAKEFYIAEAAKLDRMEDLLNTILFKLNMASELISKPE